VEPTVGELKLHACVMVHEEGHALPAELCFLQRSGSELSHEDDPAATIALPNGIWFLAAAVGSLWLGVMLFLLRRNRPPRTRTAWKLRILGRVLWGTACVVLVFGYFFIAQEDGAIPAVLQASLHRWIDGLLGSSTSAWIVLNVVLLGGGYLLLKHRIERIEVPPPVRVGWKKTLWPTF
jgi:hypothetical protein